MSERPTRTGREGSLEAPTRHALDWQNPAFWDETALERELERVFDICHGCRRCFNLCNSFPVLFDHVDQSPTGEVASMPKAAGWEVVWMGARGGMEERLVPRHGYRTAWIRARAARGDQAAA